MFKNKHFPFHLRLPIKDLASNVNTALALFHGGRSRLRFALQLATQNRPLFCDGLVDDTLHLRDLLERTYATPDGARWVRETLRDAAAPHRPDRTESSASDSSTTTGQRRREEPSSGIESTNGKYPRAYITLRSMMIKTRHRFHHGYLGDSNMRSACLRA